MTSPVSLGAPERGALLRIARASIRDAVLGSDELKREIELLPELAGLDVPRAVFVTLKAPEAVGAARIMRLRGCIGTLEARGPLREAVADMAARAATADPRFPPLSPDELEGVSVSISVLTCPEPVGSFLTIRVGEHGVQLVSGERRAVFLPQVAAEQGWDRTRLLEQLSIKAGLPQDGWRDAELSVFRAEIVEPEESGEPAAPTPPGPPIKA